MFQQLSANVNREIAHQVQPPKHFLVSVYIFEKARQIFSKNSREVVDEVGILLCCASRKDGIHLALPGESNYTFFSYDLVPTFCKIISLLVKETRLVEMSDPLAASEFETSF